MSAAAALAALGGIVSLVISSHLLLSESNRTAPIKAEIRMMSAAENIPIRYFPHQKDRLFGVPVGDGSILLWGKPKRSSIRIDGVASWSHTTEIVVLSRRGQLFGKPIFQTEDINDFNIVGRRGSRISNYIDYVPVFSVYRCRYFSVLKKNICPQLRITCKKLSNKDEDLNTSDESQNRSQPDHPLVGRRLISALLFNLIGMLSALWGGINLNELDWRSRASGFMVLTGIGLMAFGWFLLWALSLPETWGWWI